MLVAKINTKVSSIHNLCSFLFIFFSWKRQTECNTGIAQAKSCETSKLYETQRWLICNFCIAELNWATFTERVHINWWPLHLNVQLSHVKLPFRVTRQQKRIADRSLCCCVFFLSVSSSTPLMTREQRYTVLLLLAFAITWECSLKPLLLLLDNRNTPCTHNIFVCIILRFVCKAGKLTNVSDTQSGRERRRACGQSSVPAKSHQPHNEQPYQKYRASEWVSEGNSKMAIPIW